MIQILKEKKLTEEDPSADETRKVQPLATVQYFDQTTGMYSSCNFPSRARFFLAQAR